MSLLIRNGKIYSKSQFSLNDIYIEDGLIKKIAPSIDPKSTDEIINADNLLVLPGFIDPHVHLREPGDTYKEDFVSGGNAAAAGGFTTVIDMPNNSIPTITKEKYEEKISLSKKAPIDIYFHFGGTSNNFDEIKKANPFSLKLYLGKTTGSLLLTDKSLIERHFTEFPFDRPIVLHACDHTENEEENLQKTNEMVEFCTQLAKKLGRKIHLAHVSTKKEVTILKHYESATSEVSPHHLFLSTAHQERLGFISKVYPPLRSPQKNLMLWSALDLIDCIATDHAPHSIEDKEKGSAGYPGLETCFGLFSDAANHGLISWHWLIERISINPAKIFGLTDRGRIEEGLIGDITIVDPRKDWTVDPSVFFTKAKWSPFDGKKLKGKVNKTIKRGKIIYSEEEIF